MFEGITMPALPALGAQLVIGLINGGFYAMLSLGLAIIFGLLKILNFTHGAQYMLGAFTAYFLLNVAGIGYWGALILAPLMVAGFGIILERLFLRRVYQLNHIYGLLLTFGIGLMIEGVFKYYWGVTGLPYSMPESLRGGYNLGFMYLPKYRAWVIIGSVVACFGIWALIERTRLGAYLRAATENTTLVRAFGINVPRLITLTYGLGVGLAALAGVMAAPIYQVSPVMGTNLIITVFAVVVIGGMGSIIGSIVVGFGLGIVESITKMLYPQASATAIFVVMAVVLLARPAGLFGRDGDEPNETHVASTENSDHFRAYMIGAVVLGLLAPFVFYPLFLMNVLCFALFAIAFNLLVGQTGMLSFGHAAFFGGASYITSHVVKMWGFPPLLGILTGVACAAALGCVFGWLAIRRRGIYFAMVTLALAQMVFFIALQAPFTGGEEGIQSIPRGSVFGLDLDQPMNMYFFVLAIFVVGFGIVLRTTGSPFGWILRAIRDNEPRAISLGYHTKHYKLAVFILSAAIAGLAGSTKALVFQFATLTDVHWSTSGEVVLMTILGGLGTALGPVVGAFVIVTMSHYLAPLGAWVTVIQGAVFIVCVLVFRRGIVGEIAPMLGRALHNRRSFRPAWLRDERATK